MCNNDESRWHVGILIAAGAFEEAIVVLNQLVAAQGNDNEQQSWLLYLGMAHYLLGDFEMSIRSYRKVISLDDSSVAAHAFLGCIYACCPDAKIHRATIAVSHATRACELTAWRDWKSLSTLAAAYARQGKYGLAESVALTALQLARSSYGKERAGLLLDLVREHRSYTADVTEDHDKILRELAER